MKRREHEVARFGSLECDLSRFEITHFADKYYLWCLAESGTQGAGKILCIRTDLTLVDRTFLVVMQKLDRIFDGYDVVGLCIVDAIDDRRQRRTLARTGRTCKKNYSIAYIGDLDKLLRQP